MISLFIHFTVRAQASSCLGNSYAAKLSYQWELTPSSGINIPYTIRPQLVIPKQQLVGGRTYKATVVVFMQQNRALSVRAEATINVQSSNVVARITGVQTMSIIETLTLSGLASYDPDGNRGNEKVTYKWFVRNMDDSAVVSRATRKSIKLGSTPEMLIKH